MGAALLLLGLVLSGCTLVPADFMPRDVPYWSDEAKVYRAEQELEKATQESRKAGRWL